MIFDEGIRKYAPWSTPSAERVAVAAQDARLFGKHSFLPTGRGEPVEVSETESEKVYMEHQCDLAHRFNNGAVQLYDWHRKTVGPISPYWMLRLPRSGQWRYVIDRVVGRTVAGTVSFIVENVPSDTTVEDLLDRVDMRTSGTAERQSLAIISHGPQPAVMAWSDVLMDSYPDPDIAHDGLSELTVTVVIQAQEHSEALWDTEPMRERPTISLFFGLIKFQK